MDLTSLLPSLPQFKTRKSKPPPLLGNALSRAAGGSWAVPQGRAEGACLWVWSTHPSWWQALVSLPYIPCTPCPVSIFFLITDPASSRLNCFSVGMLLRTWVSHQPLYCFDCLWLLREGRRAALCGRVSGSGGTRAAQGTHTAKSCWDDSPQGWVAEAHPHCHHEQVGIYLFEHKVSHL